MASRPIRFGAGPRRFSDRGALIADAREIEGLGYSTFAMPDHVTLPFAPLIALQAVADATRTVRLTQTVLNQDFRHPAVLAKELATLDVLSGGRVEVGIGAGWMKAEYDQAGIHYAAASARIARLEEVVTVLKGLFTEDRFSFLGDYFTLTDLAGTPRPTQRPHPPIMIGGGGRKLLSVAGRHADIVQIMPRIPDTPAAAEPHPFAAETYAEKISWVRAAAGDRFPRIELAAQLVNVTITDTPDEAFRTFHERLTRQLRTRGRPVPTQAELRASPMVAIGPLDHICDQLLGIRTHLGITYFTTPVGAPPNSLAPLIERLSGR